MIGGRQTRRRRRARRPKISDLVFVALLAVAFVNPPVALIVAAVLTGRALRADNRHLAGRFGSLVLLSALTTAALFAGLAHQRGAALALEAVSFATAIVAASRAVLAVTGRN